MSHETEDWKDDKTGEDTRAAVEEWYYEGVPIAVVLKLIVWRERDQTTPGDAEGVEDLDGSIFPYLFYGGIKVKFVITIWVIL